MIWEDKTLDDPNRLDIAFLKRPFSIPLQYPYQFCHGYYYGGRALYGGGASTSVRFPPQYVHTGAYTCGPNWIGA